MISRPLLLLVFLFSGGVTLAQSPAFEELKEKFNAERVFTAEYQYIYIDSYTDETNTSEGRIWIDGVGYKVQTADQVLIVDGELSKVYDSLKNRVIISEYEVDDDAFAPSKMLSGIDETYTTSESVNDDGNTVIRLETDDDFADYLVVEIELSSNGDPLEITAWDFADNVSITTFSGGTFIDRTEDLFNLIYPEDAEIVDMRY